MRPQDTGRMLGYVRGDGLCQCGCGEATEIAWRSSTHHGWVKGQPKAYVHGHGRRKRRGVVVGEDGVMCIPLARRDGSIRAYALIDPEDEALGQLSWYLGSRGYALRQYRDDGKHRVEFLHNRVMEAELVQGLEVDHINRVKLDNRRANLRVVTHAENEQNKTGTRSSSGYRHVVWYGGRHRWVARLTVDGKWKVRTGFDTPAAAAVAAEALRKEWHPCAPSATEG